MNLFATKGRTESSLFTLMQDALAPYGLLIRLENVIVPGLPDCLFIYNQQTIFIELKIARSSKISMPIYQYSMAIAMRKYIHPNHHWYWVYFDNAILAYRFMDLANIEPKAGVKNVKLDLRGTSTLMCFTKTADLLNWLTLFEGTTQ